MDDKFTSGRVWTCICGRSPTRRALCYSSLNPKKDSSRQFFEKTQVENLSSLVFRYFQIERHQKSAPNIITEGKTSFRLKILCINKNVWWSSVFLHELYQSSLLKTWHNASKYSSVWGAHIKSSAACLDWLQPVSLLLNSSETHRHFIDPFKREINFNLIAFYASVILLAVRKILPN